MPAFPEIKLAVPYIAQTEYSSDSVQVIQINDQTEQKNLSVFCKLGDNNSFKYWITVMSGDDYTVNWTNDQVVLAILRFLVNA